MAARQKGSFSLGGTLEIKADAPADARLCVKNASELTDANSFPYKYIGMIVSVANEGKAYILTATDTTVASNWKALGEGGSGGAGGLVDGYFNPSNSLFYKESTYTTPITGSTDMLYLSLDSGKLYYFNRTIFVVVTGDGSGGLVEGYYNPTNHLFYKESTYTTPISGERDKLYLSLDTNKLYYYNGSTFIAITGEGGGGGTGGTVYTGTLLANNWNSTTKQQTLTFTGYSDTYNGVIGLPADATLAQMEAYRNSLVRTVSQTGATVTFECEEIPSINLPVEIYCGGGSGGGGSADFPAGGTTGQALVKKSNADNDVEWGTINSIPNGGTTGQALIKHSNTDKDVEWGNIGIVIKDNGSSLTERKAVNFTDFDVSDDSTNQETDVKAHRLTSSELAEICSTLPGATTQYPKYSTTEQVVGEWIDGKPIYQKTFTGTVPTFTPPSDSVLDPATLDIAMNCSVGVFVSVSGFIQTVAGNYVPLPFTEITKNVTYKESSSATTLDSYPQTIAAYGRPNASTSMPNNIRVVNMNQNFNNRPLCVTAQYTKTTD